jgi:uncharacterized protein (DUF1800 family)
MPRWLIATAALAAAAPASALAQQPMSPRDSAVHALNRIAYGPTPGQPDSLARAGVMRWIDAQLNQKSEPSRTVAERRREFSRVFTSRDDLARHFAEAERERRLMKEQPGGAANAGPMKAFRDLGGELAQWTVVRATFADHQLAEVMTDFWLNHFNVFLNKGADRYLLPSYVEETIRPRALGRFEDLLFAVAHSPAMLFYLDNAESVAQGAEPPRPDRRPARVRFGRFGAFGHVRLDDPRMDSVRAEARKRRPTGPNENYARELLELHTLGVEGGYTQADVIAAARVLTGWSVERPDKGGGFVFNDWAHDRGPKTVLGQTFPAGHGEDEGERLLRMLAEAPATMHHVSAKLCARFVSDEPSDECVDEAVAAWKRSHGEMREVLRAIFRSPAFWTPSVVEAKVKTPLEFVVSAVRAVGADPDSTPRLAQQVARLGQPLFLQPSPAGYPETQEDWVNSGALLSRMTFASMLAGGRLPGTVTNLDAVSLATTDYDALVEAVNQRCLSGRMTEHTRQVIRKALAEVRDPVEARALAVGLALGGPEFQRQ